MTVEVPREVCVAVAACEASNNHLGLPLTNRAYLNYFVNRADEQSMIQSSWYCSVPAEKGMMTRKYT